MKESKKELMALLREIYDDHDFVCGAMSNAGGENGWKKMIEFIRFAKQNNKEITSDDILALSLVVGDETETKSSRRSSIVGKVAAF